MSTALSIGVTAASAAPTVSVLIDGSSLVNGTNSPEYQDAIANGYSVTIVSGAQWASMTAAQFASYNALVVGDPACGYVDPSVTGSASVWAPVVMGKSVNSVAGNRIVIGTDPVFHGLYGGVPSALKLVQAGINYVGSSPAGTTGLYYDASCSYEIGGGSDVPVLNQLTSTSGGWSESANPPCGGNVSLITASGAFSGLTSGDLEGWDCSVHETFPSFPSDWSPLAIATDTASHPVCGTDVSSGANACGEAYVLVAGAGLVETAPNLTLTPTSGTDPSGGTHTVTANVTQGGSPLSGQTVTFAVTGQNAGATGTCAPTGCVTDSNGNVSFTYSDSNGAGTDTVIASFVNASGSREQATASETWAGAIATAISWATPSTITYGTGFPSSDLDASVSPSGVAGTISYTVGSPSGATLSSGEVLPAGTDELYATFTPSASGYTSSSTSVALTVAPAPLTVTASSPPDMTYGGSVPTVTPSYSGFVNGDSASSLTTAPSCGTAASSSSPVGPYETSCSGASDPNYDITYVNGSLNVDPAPLTITASDAGMNYGGTVPTIAPVYSGFVNGDSASSLTSTPTCTTKATSASPVGKYSSSCEGAADPNYSISYVDGTVTVAPVTLTITASSPQMTYGGAAPTVTASYSGFVNGDSPASLTTLPTCTTTAGPTSQVGSTQTTSCTGASDPNYTIVYADGSVTINPAPLTITASDTTSVYGSAVPAVTPSFSGFVNGEGASVLGSGFGCSSTATASSPVGSTQTTSCSGASDANYAITYVNGTSTITPAPLTVTASSSSTVYGSAVPAVTASYSGFVNGDSVSSLTTTAVCTTQADATKPVGDYTTSCSGASDPNYAISYVNGTAAITPAPLVITASSPTMTYAAAVPSITPSYSGFVNGDNASSLTNAPVCTTTATTSSQPGTYPTSCSGASDPNYTISYVGGTLNLLLVAACPNSVYYGTGANLAGTSFSGKNMTGKSFVGDNLVGANFDGTNLKDANFAGADLQGASFKGANLMGASFTGANLYGASLQGTNLMGDDISCADLQGASLKGANMKGDNLSGDNLENVTFEGTNLMKANLSNSNMTGATFTGANTKDADWTGATCPDGSSANSDGGSCSGTI